MSIGRWSELSVEHEVRYTGNEKPFTITMFKTSGVAKELYGLVVGCLFQRSHRSSHRHGQVGFPHLVFRREFQYTCLALRSPSKIPVPPPSHQNGGQVRSDQWAGRRKVSRKDFHRSAGKCGSSLQAGQARNGH